MSAAVTLKKLSFLSGYSVSTVSKALNNKTDISKGTRDAIRDMAKQHNYVPNSYAVSLRNRKSKSIAVIIPEITKPPYGQALCALQKHAEEHDYRVLFYQSYGSKSKEEEYIKSLNDGSIYGIILVTNQTKSNTDFMSDFTLPIERLHIKSEFSNDEIKKRSTSTLLQLIESNH